jgi:ribosome-associated toxin RatA of RatAB toxin-antitoxin module
MTRIELLKTLNVDKEDLFRVIVDYEPYPEFVYGVKSVQVTRSNGGQARVSYRLSLLKDLNYTLKVVESENPCRVQWWLLESEFFKANSGLWEVKSLGHGRCEVRCRVELDFRVPIPSFILNRFVKKALLSLVSGFEKRARSERPSRVA